MDRTADATLAEAVLLVRGCLRAVGLPPRPGNSQAGAYGRSDFSRSTGLYALLAVEYIGSPSDCPGSDRRFAGGGRRAGVHAAVACCGGDRRSDCYHLYHVGPVLESDRSPANPAHGRDRTMVQ